MKENKVIPKIWLLSVNFEKFTSGVWRAVIGCFIGPRPRHLLGSHTVLGMSVPGGLNFALFMAYSFSYKFS